MSWLEELFFPKKCLGCRRLGEWICKECLGGLVKAEGKCPMCCRGSVGGLTHRRCRRMEGLEGLVAGWTYRQKGMRAIVAGIKYGFCQKGLERLVEDFEGELPEIDWVVPIPLHKQRENWRGFNQAEVMARYLAKKAGLQVKVVLVRKKKTRPLAEMGSVEERKREMKAVFGMSREGEGEVAGKRVLLVDDVFTSGTTMREAARVLKNVGAKEVWGWVLAS